MQSTDKMQDAFKKNEKTTKVNASLYECLMIGVEDYNIDVLLKKKDKILNMIQDLLNDAEFVESIDKATGNTEVIKKRLSTFITRLGEIMHEQDAIED